MKRFSFILILCLICSLSYTQSNSDGINHYIFPEFTKGTVLMKGGARYEGAINYNSVTEEMVFDKKGKKMAIGKDEMGRIDTIFIKDRKFFVLEEKFVELVYHSTSDLYAEHKCRLIPPGKPVGYGGTSQTAATTSYSALISDGTVYELQLPEGYEVKPYTCYWLNKNGELNKFLNLKQLMKLYGDKEDICKAYIKEHEIKFEDQDGVIQLIKYMETN